MSCSILIPTHRTDESSYIGLETMCLFAGKKDLHVRIADNSTNAEKHVFLRSLAAKNENISLYLHSKNIGALNNFIYLMDQSIDDEWIHMAADDDILTWGGVSNSMDLAQKEPTAAAVTGHSIALQHNGLLSAEKHEYLQKLPSERLQHWFTPYSWNLLHYSLIRRKSIQPWIDFVKLHPLQAPFFDFLLTASVVASGPVYHHHKGAYLWHSDNWDSPEKNLQSKVNAYQAFDLNQEFIWLSDMQFAVETASFFLGQHSPIQDTNQRQACAQIMWNQCMHRFTELIKASTDTLNRQFAGNPDLITLVNFFTSNQEPINTSILKKFPQILQHFNPKLAVEYGSFQNKIFTN